MSKSVRQKHMKTKGKVSILKFYSVLVYNEGANVAYKLLIHVYYIFIFLLEYTLQKLAAK